jgi:activating signal cointegrator complex subunit 2
VADAFKDEQEAKSAKVSNGFHFEPEVEDEDEMEGACALPLSKPEPQEAPINVEEQVQVETSKILELFPNFGVGYIRRLLAFYDNSSETVVSKILEGNLDPKFSECDELEPYIPPESPDKVFLATGIERSNIYDGDKFDVMRNDEFGGHIKKNGKFITKKEPKTYHELLNDKSHVKEMKERYQAYGLVTENTEDNEYDDEPDDSYDNFAESEPKVHMKMHGNMRDMLPDNVEVIESEDEEDEPEASPKKNPLDFCENPEIIRQRREQQYQQRMAKKFPNRPQEQKSGRDVVGAQKGQGQSNEVLRNRQQKNTNKSSRANHNRKSGSTFKQSRGMF